MDGTFTLCTCFILVLGFSSSSYARPERIARQAPTATSPDGFTLKTISTPYGDLEGKSYSVGQNTLDIFLGIPYAEPPVGDLRFAAPKPIQPWETTRNATAHGAKCWGRIIPVDPVLENVPYGEDCLFVDVYAPRFQGSSHPNPVMIYIHPGGYYGGTGAKYNYTNLAMKGVTVAVLSFRNDIFGFLSTMNDEIPGNFALLDKIMGIDFVKEVIPFFGGDPYDVTLFGSSSGAASISILTLSPLTEGKFSKAIIQSGSALAAWAVYDPQTAALDPRRLAWLVGQYANCSLPENYMDMDSAASSQLLLCLRAVPAEDLTQLSEYIQMAFYQGAIVFKPVPKDTFGVIPDLPVFMMEGARRLPQVQTMHGFTSEDGAWLLEDPENKGFSLEEARSMLMQTVVTYYPPDQVDYIYQQALAHYFPPSADTLSRLELRDRLVYMVTDFAFVSPAVKETLLLDRKSQGARNFVYEFSYRPSFSESPAWAGVGHSDDKGFVLGLPEGPDPFKYPDVTSDDEKVADLMTTMWTNFAKYGNPTPTAIDGVVWPEFGRGHGQQDILVIQPRLEVKTFDRFDGLRVWTGDTGLPSSGIVPGITLFGCLFYAVFAVLLK